MRESLPPMTQLAAVAPAPDEPQAYVIFSAEIVPQTAESLIALLAQLVNQGLRHIGLLLSTPGGSVMNGMNLYNVLRALPCTLTAHNVGNVDSIGNAIFLAGDHRYASPHSTFMFHGVGFDPPPGTRLEEKQLREYLDGIAADQKRIASIITERSSLTETEVAELFLEARTKDADYAASHGIVHEVRDVNIPPGVPVQSLVFQR